MAGVASGQFTTEDQIIGYFSRLLRELHDQDAMDIAPHMVMSHGFMEWYALISQVAPGIIPPDRVRYDLFCRRFFRFMGHKGHFLDQDDITILKLQGWKEFLKD